MSDPKDVNEIIGALEEAGFEVAALGHPPGKCERCGAEVDELAFGACFVCGMWEDPSSDEWELLSGVNAAFHAKIFYSDWIAGREAWGKLVPDDTQRGRIKAAIRQYARETLYPWLEAHKTELDA